MKTKGNKKLKDRNNNKIKRQVSIITVFLWIFLVATMVTIVSQNIKNTNALEHDNVQIYGEISKLNNDDTSNYVNNKPEPPTVDKIVNSEAMVQFICQDNANHNATGSFEENEEIIVGEVIENDGSDGISATTYPWICDIKLNMDFWINLYNEYANSNRWGEHCIINNNSSLRLYYTSNSGKWTYKKSSIPLEIEITHINKKYTVVYTDGVPGELVFADQRYGDLEEGVHTPKFEGDIKRKGYQFMGWAPALNPIIYPDASDENGVITYMATWKKSNITGIDKDLIKYEHELPEEIKEILELSGDSIYYCNNEKYVVAYEGSTINLVYKVTVTGEENAEYKIEDEDAEWIGGDAESGEIPESGIVEMYYKKSFKIEKDTKRLKNSATVIPGKNGETTSNSTVFIDVIVKNYSGSTISLYVRKIWEDDNNKAGKRPESITVQLKDGENVVREAVLNEKNNWQYIFNEVNEYREDGNIISYTIDEKETTEFYEKELFENKIINRFVVPDTKVKIKGTKVWEDNDNEFFKRPENIILQLKDGENIIEEKEVSEENNWSSEFEVPKYDELGNEIKYTVDEKETSKYYEKIIDGYTVINKYIGEEKDENNNEIKNDEENNVGTSDINVIFYVIIFFVAIIGIIYIIYFIRKNKINKK